MIEEGGESYTANSCPCTTSICEGKRRKTTDKLAVERVRRAKSAPWKALENDGRRTIYKRNERIFFAKKRDRVKRFRKQAEEKRQAATKW